MGQNRKQKKLYGLLYVIDCELVFITEAAAETDHAPGALVWACNASRPLLRERDRVLARIAALEPATCDRRSQTGNRQTEKRG
jgi:hypothetical protein